MRNRDLMRKLARKNTDLDKLAADAAARPDLLSDLLGGLTADDAAVKYSSAKVLRIVSERHPSTLYPRIGMFFDLLGAENQILQWEGIHVLGNLAAVDSRGKITRNLDRYLEFLKGPKLISAANAIAGATKIALAKPRLTGKIVSELLKVEKARYRTPDCRNIALGKVVEALDRLYDQTPDKPRVAKLVRRQLRNSRPSTRKKAERFVKRRLS